MIKQLGFTSAAALLLALLSGCQTGPADQPLVSPPADLKATVVTPHLDTPIQPGQNLLWCGTFQLAWNEACNLLGEDLHFAQRVEDFNELHSETVDALNKKSFTRESLDDASYVALAGFGRDHVIQRIHQALDKKFQGHASPQLIPLEGSIGPSDIVAYAYLSRAMEFAKPFEKIDEHPLIFIGLPVKAFGIAPPKPDEENHDDMARQVVILDYKSERDFVIELKTKSAGGRLILAKITPGKTLAETIRSLDQRTVGQGETASSSDVLEIPKLNFDITRHYDELEGLHLISHKEKMETDYTLQNAIQNIRFQMDEYGVKLESEATMWLKFGSAGAPPQHIMIFDKPFLLMLKRAGAKTPYFALWIENPEVLIPFSQPLR